MSKEFEHQKVGNGSRLIKSTCNLCHHAIAVSQSKRALKIAEDAHRKNSRTCDRNREQRPASFPS